jgi:hypothetical protein
LDRLNRLPSLRHACAAPHRIALVIPKSGWANAKNVHLSTVPERDTVQLTISHVK